MIKNGGNFCCKLDFAAATLADTLRQAQKQEVELAGAGRLVALRVAWRNAPGLHRGWTQFPWPIEGLHCLLLPW